MQQYLSYLSALRWRCRGFDLSRAGRSYCHPMKPYFHLPSMENKFINRRRPKDILLITFLSYIQSKKEICPNQITMKLEFYKITVKFFSGRDIAKFAKDYLSHLEKQKPLSTCISLIISNWKLMKSHFVQSLTCGVNPLMSAGENDEISLSHLPDVQILFISQQGQNPSPASVIWHPDINLAGVSVLCSTSWGVLKHQN